MKDLRQNKKENTFAHTLYDDFFDARSPVNGIQFCGLIVIGAALVISGGGLFLSGLSHFVRHFQSKGNESLALTKIAEFLIFIPVVFFIIYFGVAHFKRAFAGKKRP